MLLVDNYSCLEVILLYTTAKDNTLYYFDNSGAHKYAKTYRRFDLLKKAYKELSTTPVYSYSKVVYFYKVKTFFSNSAKGCDPWLCELIAPILYINDNGSLKRVSLTEIIEIFANSKLETGFTPAKYRFSNHTRHRAYHHSKPKIGMLHRYYENGLDVDKTLPWRHKGRWGGSNSSYEEVYDWDYNEHPNTSGWKSKRHKHQWEHNLK